MVGDSAELMAARKAVYWAHKKVGERADQMAAWKADQMVVH